MRDDAAILAKLDTLQSTIDALRNDVRELRGGAGRAAAMCIPGGVWIQPDFLRNRSEDFSSTSSRDEV